jgi:solute carrier family 25 S-adenosylmethionine transporter 26
VAAVRNPFEVVKQQMQAGLHASTRDAVRTILRVEGWRGFFAGYGSTVAREIPFDAIEFALYEKLKATWKEHKQMRAAPAADGSAPAPVDLVFGENAACGSVAGGVAAAVTTPLDVVKTRLMTQIDVSKMQAATAQTAREGMEAMVAVTHQAQQPAAGAALAAHDRYKGWADAMVRIYREEGMAALYSGIRPRVAWISLGGAIFIGSFEELKRRMSPAVGANRLAPTREG